MVFGAIKAKFADHNKHRSLDYWLRSNGARSPDQMQAEGSLVEQLVGTGHFQEIVMACPDTGRQCKGLKLLKTPGDEKQKAATLSAGKFLLTSNASDITSALNDFNASYHLDFKRVRAIAGLYLKSERPADQATDLAKALCQALKNWGAGYRKAPKLHDAQRAALMLSDPVLHERLAKLSRCGVAALVFDAAGLRILSSGSPFAASDEFDSELLSTLNSLAAAFLIDNTNVTYPMKALLLVTGLMPALDSQVRRGLKRAGMSGLTSTQVLLPASPNTAIGQRICNLPFLLGNCWKANHKVLHRAIYSSNYPELTNEPGRVFDVLLFMQQEASRPLMVTFESRQ